MLNKKANLKIIHLLYSGLGGHSSVFFSLREADSARAFTHVPIFGGVESLYPATLEKCVNEAIPYISLLKAPGLDISFYKKILYTLRQEKPGIIFLHGAGFILPAFLYKLIYPSVKVIVRDTQAAHLKTKLDWTFLFIGYLICNKMIFLTSESRNKLKQKLLFLFCSSKVAIVANGINIKTFSPATVARDRNVINIGMQSRLQDIKDHPSLIKAFKKVVDIYPQINLQLHIAGTGTTLQSLEDMVKQLGLNTNVHFWGMLNEHELIKFCQNLNIYVHATYGETMSNSILQAMSCGLPVIASDVWGVNNMITDNVTGILYKSKDVDQLVEKIKYLINDPSLSRRLGSAARKEVEKKYSAEDMYKAYKEIFIEMINKR